MDYNTLLQDMYQLNVNMGETIKAIEEFNALPIPSKQIHVDVQVSGLEIQMHNLANQIRERLLH